jgi:hypothetical protein
MRTKKLGSGETAYYWQAPERVKRLGIPMHAEPLGTDFEAAVTRAAMLNRLVQSYVLKRTKKRKKSTRVPSFQTPIPVTAPKFSAASSGVTSAASVTADVEQMELVA